MKYLVLFTALAFMGCGTNYDYKPGTQASDINQSEDSKICNDQAWNTFFDSNHDATISRAGFVPIGYGLVPGLAISVVSVVVGNTLAEQTAEHSKPGPLMTKDDIEPLVHDCMVKKGYILK